MAQARRGGANPYSRLSGLFLRHSEDCRSALLRLLRRPLSTGLTAIAIGITLALPLCLRVLLQNVDAASYSWERSFHLTVFLQLDVDDRSGAALAREIGKRPEVVDSEFIDRAAALAEFRALSGFEAALDLLDENPLPAVIVLGLRTDLHPEVARKFAAEVEAREDVHQVQVDSAWLQRLQAIARAGHRAVSVLAALLGIAVLIIIGNTIRLDVQNRRDEIVVMKLIGATDAFVRRPFLYAGLGYGLFGSLIALLSLSIALMALSGPVQALAGLYDSQFALSGLAGRDVLWVLLLGPLLGLAGSILAVGAHIAAIEPE